MTKRSTTVISGTCNQRIEGLGEHVSPKTEILINGTSQKLATVLGIYQACLDTRSTLNSKRGEVKVALAARNEAETSRLAIEEGLQQWVFSKFGATSQAAHDMGFAPRKKATVSVGTKNQAVQQALATREARGTMGKKEKLKVKGTIVPATPAAPASTASPAAVAPAPTGTPTPHS